MPQCHFTMASGRQSCGHRLGNTVARGCHGQVAVFCHTPSIAWCTVLSRQLLSLQPRAGLQHVAQVWPGCQRDHDSFPDALQVWQGQGHCPPPYFRHMPGRYLWLLESQPLYSSRGCKDDFRDLLHHHPAGTGTQSTDPCNKGHAFYGPMGCLLRPRAGITHICTAF